MAVWHEALREEGTLNPTPDEVHDPKFQDNEFFEPHEIVQVKYEMLRRVSVENASVSAATGRLPIKFWISSATTDHD